MVSHQPLTPISPISPVVIYNLCRGGLLLHLPLVRRDQSQVTDSREPPASADALNQSPLTSRHWKDKTFIYLFKGAEFWSRIERYKVILEAF